MLIKMNQRLGFFLPFRRTKMCTHTWRKAAVVQCPPWRGLYSITYSHDGEQWTATVGEQPGGVRERKVSSRGNKRFTGLMLQPWSSPFLKVIPTRSSRMVACWKICFLISFYFFNRSSAEDSCNLLFSSVSLVLLLPYIGVPGWTEKRTGNDDVMYRIVRGSVQDRTRMRTGLCEESSRWLWKLLRTPRRLWNPERQ